MVTYSQQTRDIDVIYNFKWKTIIGILENGG